MLSIKRLSPVTALVAATLFLPAIGDAQTVQSPPATPAIPAAPATPTAAQADDVPWLFKGSDIPPDRAWTFGVLPNGLRYAVRNNGVPPQQVSVRVAIDAGSLMEQDHERGFAHLLEHLTVRGSEHVPDGESKRVWQRLGVTFGADSNASTSFTQTVYKLDLPAATPEGLDESLRILSGMMTGPVLTQQALDAERPVVLAELRERPGAQVRMSDASREHVFQGQPIAERSPIGTIPTLQGATAATVNAFHKRWYRPDRAVVIIVGDADPAALEAAVKKHFSDWKAEGPAPAEPDFGKPVATGKEVRVVTEPALPPMLSYAYVRPWAIEADTILFNQERMIDWLAVQVLNRRLESRARAGGSFISAQASLDDVSRSANVTSLQILPLGDDWQAALRDVRTAVAELIAVPPAQAEIDQEVAVFRSGLETAVATARVEAGALIADNLAEAVSIRETVAGPVMSLEIFKGAVDKGFFVPARIKASLEKLMQGTARRALINTPKGGDGVEAKLAAALDAPVTVPTTQSEQRAVSFDQLPKLGQPGKVVARKSALTDPAVEQVDYSNGSKLLLFSNDAETGKVYVKVRFGRGRQALPRGRESAAWAAGLALLPGGIGDLSQDEIDRMTAGRQIGMQFAIEDDSFVLAAQTTPADLKDQLRLIAAKLAKPAWDPRVVERARAVALAGYDTRDLSPDSVLSAELDRLMMNGDPRWGQPDRAAIEATTPAAFRKLWEPLLATGPVEVQVFGDVPAETAVAAVAETIGALAKRRDAPASTAGIAFAKPVEQPVTRTHRGQEDQAAAVIAWPTGGGSAGIAESRKLELLAAIFRDRLFDQLRSQAGVSYTPNVANQWPVGLPAGGSIMAIGQVPPDKTDFFFKLAGEIAADLAANPVSPDEYRRAVVPTLQLISRYASGNMFWMQQTEGGTRDPTRLAAVDTLIEDFTRSSPEEIQALAAKYLVPGKAWKLAVVPDAKPAGTAAAASAGR
ncbi:M16 family metallopeptidase [Sphingomonas sp. FW199]|uniref:M16 family metallopeptidase n=1 Tax=Sphingomonas sp. FW199 TaxID=3400217 RepID=UPI003CEE395F